MLEQRLPTSRTAMVEEAIQAIDNTGVTIGPPFALPEGLHWSSYVKKFEFEESNPSATSLTNLISCAKLTAFAYTHRIFFDKGVAVPCSHHKVLTTLTETRSPIPKDLAMLLHHRLAAKCFEYMWRNCRHMYSKHLWDAYYGTIGDIRISP